VDEVDAVLAQWRRERPDVDTRPIEVVGRLMRLSRIWNKEIKDFLATHGLEPSEFDVLSTLRRSGSPYELTPGEFLNASLVTSGAITNRIDRMEGKDLVIRVRDTKDRRSVKIRLTQHGLDVIDRVLPLHIANEARLLQALPETGLDQLAGLLSTLLTSTGESPDAV
jgi:DNA-binding MarR family transcriptional regulator